MSRSFIIAILTGTAIFIGSAAFAGGMVKTQGYMHHGQRDVPPPPGDMMDGPHMEQGMFFGNPEVYKTKLGLSDEQVNKIGKINLEYKKKLLNIRETMQPKRIKLQRLLLEDEVNLKDVRALLNEISALEVEIRMQWINHRLDIDKVLTPEQRNKLRNSMGGLMR